jgi:hypothetical protein
MPMPWAWTLAPTPSTYDFGYGSGFDFDRDIPSLPKIKTGIRFFRMPLKNASRYYSPAWTEFTMSRTSSVVSSVTAK